MKLIIKTEYLHYEHKSAGREWALRNSASIESITVRNDSASSYMSDTSHWCVLLSWAAFTYCFILIVRLLNLTLLDSLTRVHTTELGSWLIHTQPLWKLIIYKKTLKYGYCRQTVTTTNELWFCHWVDGVFAKRKPLITMVNTLLL